MLSLKLKFRLKNISKIFDSKIFKILVAVNSLIFFIIILLAGSYYFYYWGRIFPNVYIAGISVGGNTPEKTITILSKTIAPIETIVLRDDNQEFQIKTSDIELAYDYTKTVSSAYDLYRTGNVVYDSLGRVNLLFKGTGLGLRYEINSEKLQEILSVIAGQVSQDPTYPAALIVDNQIIIDAGKAGREVDLEKLLIDIGHNLAFARNRRLSIPTTIINPVWSDNNVAQIKMRAENLIGKSLNFTFEHQVFSYAEADLVSFLDKDNGFNLLKITQEVEKIEKQVNREPENSVFVFKEGRAEEFVASKDGVGVDKQTLANAFTDNIKVLETGLETSVSVSLPVVTTSPDITTSEVNNLGIKELIGRGESKFAGSIASRIHNIGLASLKFNGVLVEPGKEISFNDILGDVSSYTGYKQAYVIKDGKTVLGDGGGVCQVSTTLFRAILDAGLPVVERRAHSYRVGYYEQDSPPGLDATVYAPTTDLKFNNDTPGYLLIQTLFDPKKYVLVFEIYGTKDGRMASITKPVVGGVTPPPEDLYIDDPTLPTGVIKQTDYKAWGAKVTFSYKVERGGQIIFEKTFLSNYRAWQAKFLKGTGPT
ncbi:hypothetical protein A2962_01735 [Candidatus Woesebacteria bacterium RIFCSPLOWO2_01_FULL_39_61]|uniref:YoaR-like putative peptidoglycan binding domain-containing protein n=1 Tax=Candidatus Woesebacteria bacterium RIFCSPHIGHO2_02_FULL_39_13 TaxID=1802505 RepID=A0A1F7Z716_9BACT|nr:MAG: hypothetical protein A2692_01975 [Candidatus Woesebacteria bacterium RIFCSPHIGHO2_01_FULL_39_95]OGM34565.1 MAG: hypothetical protein A3D01_03425 [Candidatus Woesebacteria bacterium RIFCSPHIGHO2_02_FULL_39_13]OGM38832.1 MAG: hypothetical protein A3E13_01320 [Candidatus Woesebacteria bacterium RIFCSPHIGHO2_12_FULL_40_20]OGM65838.1 MAG: hypothetical protein A2962_01735 [Candidatus Woesebacteria bacterium RIFCSPLOWO2_01_FULL_39_61]OGM71652.1 MAG: hypothetical protein A3H19_05040 [Candidatus